MIAATLAIGIGANTAIFTLLSEIYQPDVRAPDSGRLFSVHTGTLEQPRGGASYLDALDYREAVSGLGKLGVQRLFGAVLGLPALAMLRVRIATAWVSRSRLSTSSCTARDSRWGVACSPRTTAVITPARRC